MLFDEFVQLLSNGYYCHCETLEDRYDIMRAVVDAEQCHDYHIGPFTKKCAKEMGVLPSFTEIAQGDGGLITARPPRRYPMANKTQITSSNVLPFTDCKVVPPDAGFSGLYDWL